MDRAGHEKQLRDAIERADIPPRDYRIFGALLYRIQWGKDYIPARFQPRSVLVLAEWCRMSKTATLKGLEHLEAHGWVVRERPAAPVAGRSVLYVLAVGKDCDCPPRLEHPPPISDAERMRNWRARQAAIRVSHVSRYAESASPVTYSDRTTSQVTPGFPAEKGSVTRGEEEDWALRLSPWQEEERWR